MLGDEGEMRQRVSGMSVVEQEETERVMRPNVLRRDARGHLSRIRCGLRGIAVALTVHRGDREVDAEDSSRSGSGRTPAR